MQEVPLLVVGSAAIDSFYVWRGRISRVCLDPFAEIAFIAGWAVARLRMGRGWR